MGEWQRRKAAANHLRQPENFPVGFPILHDAKFLKSNGRETNQIAEINTQITDGAHGTASLFFKALSGHDGKRPTQFKEASKKIEAASRNAPAHGRKRGKLSRRRSAAGSQAAGL